MIWRHWILNHSNFFWFIHTHHEYLGRLSNLHSSINQNAPNQLPPSGAISFPTCNNLNNTLLGSEIRYRHHGHARARPIIHINDAGSSIVVRICCIGRIRRVTIVRLWLIVLVSSFHIKSVRRIRRISWCSSKFSSLGFRFNLVGICPLLLYLFLKYAVISQVANHVHQSLGSI